MKCSQGPLQQQLDPCPQGALLPWAEDPRVELVGLPAGPEETVPGPSGASWAHHLVTCWGAQSHRAELKQKGKQENLASASHPASNAQMPVTASVSLRFPCPRSDLFEFCQKAPSYCRRGIIHKQKQLVPP